jgi:hypothetical protein
MRNMIVVDDFPKLREEKVAILFYNVVRMRSLRKWLGRRIRSRELRTPRIQSNRRNNRNGRSENPS